MNFKNIKFNYGVLNWVSNEIELDEGEDEFLFLIILAFLIDSLELFSLPDLLYNDTDADRAELSANLCPNESST